LSVRIGWASKGSGRTIAAIDLAASAGIRHVAVDGVVRKAADSVVSLPGLLNYLPAESVALLLDHARTKHINLRPLNQADPFTVAREIWSALNTARAMGFDLGKYGLVPLSLEDCAVVVQHVQKWFPDWCAAPVFYVDQGLVSRHRVYFGSSLAAGVKVWLRVMAKNRVRIVLIDTVDKSLGWRILKTNGDPQGLLTSSQIASIDALARSLRIHVLWAGGITIDHAYEFGRLGVFGIYVTTAASVPAAVSGDYAADPALAAAKKPTYAGVMKVKTALDAGFLGSQLQTKRPTARAARLLTALTAGVQALDKLEPILPDAWKLWWRTRRPSRPRAARVKRQ
jgi:hypothetical protein